MISGLGGSEVRPPSSSSSPLLLEGELVRFRGPSGEGARDTGLIGERGAGRASELVKKGLLGWQVSADALFCVGSSASGKLSGTKAENKEEVKSGGVKQMI